MSTDIGWRITAFRDRHDNVWEAGEPYAVQKLKLRGANNIRKERVYIEADAGPLIPVEVDNVAGLMQGYRKAIEWNKELHEYNRKLRHRLRRAIAEVDEEPLPETDENTNLVAMTPSDPQ